MTELVKVTALAQCRSTKQFTAKLVPPFTNHRFSSTACRCSVQGTTVRQSLVMMHALPAPHTPDHASHQLALPVSSAAAGLPPLPHPASTKGGPNSKYFSPLNTNKGHNSVVAQLAEMRSSMHVGGSDNGGDTHSVAASDQQAPRDKNVTFANQVRPCGSQVILMHNARQDSTSSCAVFNEGGRPAASPALPSAPSSGHLICLRGSLLARCQSDCCVFLDCHRSRLLQASVGGSSASTVCGCSSAAALVAAHGAPLRRAVRQTRLLA
jgi:hypothetical protein